MILSTVNNVMRKIFFLWVTSSRESRETTIFLNYFNENYKSKDSLGISTMRLSPMYLSHELVKTQREHPLCANSVKVRYHDEIVRGTSARL